MTQPRWRILPHDSARAAELERSANLPSVVAQLLVKRGIFDANVARQFLDPKLKDLREPDLLPGAKEAAKLLQTAIKNKKRILVHGDYDADGMTSTAILHGCLKMLGADVYYHVPNRLEDGYGVKTEVVRREASRGAQVMITCDCGITAIEPVAAAKELGMQVIVTDHHEFTDELPAADVIVHPRLPGGNYPFGGLCGAGVALKVAWALCQQASDSKKVGERMRNFLIGGVGLAALGTIADVVPLADENRSLVKHGLRCLAQDPPLGLKALMQLAKVERNRETLSSEDIGFMLAPRLNAAGRLGQAQLGVELLTTTSPARAEALAEYLHELNNSRVSLEKSVYLQAIKQIKEQFDPVRDPALVLAGRGWHGGVVGIVAGRLAEKFHRPVIMLSMDSVGAGPAGGSARTIGDFHLHKALGRCEHLLLGYGGHAAAAGLRLEEAHIDAFREQFLEVAAEELTEADLTPEVRIDVEAPLAQLTLKTVRQIESLAPFGAANPRPLFCATDIQLASPPKKIGGGERHLSLRLRQHGMTMRAISFGRGEDADSLAEIEGPLDIAFHPMINSFNGMQNVELQVVEWRKSEALALADAG